MAVEAEDLAEGGQQLGDLGRVRSPLLPGAEDPGQGSVGQDHQGGVGVQAG